MRSFITIFFALFTLPAYAANVQCAKEDMIGQWQQVQAFIVNQLPADWPIYEQQNVMWRFTPEGGFRTYSLTGNPTMEDLQKFDSAPLTMGYEMAGVGRFNLTSKIFSGVRAFECLKATETDENYQMGDLILRDFRFGTEPYAYILLRRYNAPSAAPSSAPPSN